MYFLMTETLSGGEVEKELGAKRAEPLPRHCPSLVAFGVKSKILSLANGSHPSLNSMSFSTHLQINSPWEQHLTYFRAANHFLCYHLCFCTFDSSTFLSSLPPNAPSLETQIKCPISSVSSPSHQSL